MRPSSRIVVEPAREIEVIAECDVLVCGAGPAGVGAATSAARIGAKTILLEQDGCLGGSLTTGIVHRLGPFHDQEKIILGGIPWEVVERLVALGAAPSPEPCSPDDHDGYWIPFDSQAMRHVVEEMVGAAGVETLLFSLASTPLVDEGRVNAVVLENKSGRVAIAARIVVDATGDGDVSARAGAPYTKGTEDGQMQEMTLYFKLHGVDVRMLSDYRQNHRKDLEETNARASAEGVVMPGYFLEPGRDLPGGEVYYNTRNAPKGADGTNAAELSHAQMEAARKIWQTVEFLRRHVPGHENALLCAVASRIGVRETRHVLGEYVLTGPDVLSAEEFPDGVARYACHLDRAITKRKARRLRPGTSYGIPYRCLVPKNTSNMLVAGRCFSATHEAASSARMMPCCLAMGQAAGTAAALAAKQNIPPKELDVKQLQDALRSQGVII